MIGFEVSVNGENVSAAVGRGVLTLIITRLDNERDNYISLDIGGRDELSHTRPSWKSMNLKEGDEIHAKIRNIESVSAPETVKPLDEKLDKERMLASYRHLKERLEQEGWL